MPEGWRLISGLNGNASMNMAIDEAIAIAHPEPKSTMYPPLSASGGRNTLRFYTWNKPAVSIGYFQRILPVINWLNNSPSLNTPLYPLLIEGKGTIDIVRRPTGGGVVLHNTDLTYSVVIRNKPTARNLIPLFYRQMGQAVVEGLRLLGIRNSECAMPCRHDVGVRSTASGTFSSNSELRTPNSKDSFLCAQTPVESDVLVEGTKVAGCAARRFQETLLLQGCISIGHITDVTTRQLIDAMIKGFMTSLNIELEHGKLTDVEVALAEELNRKKYSRDEWNYKR